MFKERLEAIYLQEKETYDTRHASLKYLKPSRYFKNPKSNLVVHDKVL